MEINEVNKELKELEDRIKEFENRIKKLKEFIEVNEKLKGLDDRIKKLKEFIDPQNNSEFDINKKVLLGLETSYKKLKGDNNAFVPEASSAKNDNCISQEEVIQRLGAIYWIFGQSYEETLGYKRYRIEFLNILPSVDDLVIKVNVNIYEMDKDFQMIMENATIIFCLESKDNTKIIEARLVANGLFTHYSNYHWFQKISYTLVKIWNKYFQEEKFEDIKSMIEGSERISITKKVNLNVDYIPKETLRVINEFRNPEINLLQPIGNELFVYVPVYSKNMEQTLLYALISGTAYEIVGKSIYIWYSPLIGGIEGAGFFRLKRFIFLEEGRSIIYFLDPTKKLG